MNWLDLGLILIIMGAGLVGYRRGFWREAAGLLPLLMGIWIALHYHRLLALFLESHFFWRQRLENWLFTHQQWAYSGSETGVNPGLPTELLTFYTPYLQKVFNSIFLDLFNTSGRLFIDTANRWWANTSSWLIMDAAAFGFLVILITLSLRLVFRWLGWLCQHGGLGVINRTAGLLFALAVQGLFLALIFGGLIVVWPWLSFISKFKEAPFSVILGTALETSKLVPLLLGLYTQLLSPVIKMWNY